ncbi:hypothetical protein SISSUDRAFT_1056030 [Sistotremastrum suecicum HHB10207 ss-3]|uniref:Uncharacterized protein n=1 Tax=Sistotremastrum suecicum HHB10207 ss-3 TaxID=1314776 RepID=A0A165XCC7_9AGAM|nr:hypothetical protein SISSUDRAFT_1056030 [Sistotremastrum suecicum HHB10207 ss-3]
MQSRLERAQGALQKIADAMLRDGWGLYPTSEEGISHRLTFGYTDPTPLGYQRPYTTVLIPTQVQSLLGAFNDPKESWTTIFAQEMYRAAYHTVGLLSEIVFILMVCCPGLIAFRYRLEDHPLTMNKSMVIFVPPNSWLQRRADVLSHIVGEHSAARFLSLSQSQTYMIDQA